MPRVVEPSTRMTRSRTKKQATEAAQKSLALVTLCNPLLDISTRGDEDILKKYDLKADNAIMAEEKHVPMYGMMVVMITNSYEELMKDYDVTYIAGGAGQNTTRVAQWMLTGSGFNTAFIGCVGEDEYANVLRKAATKDGVNVLYKVDKTHPTGTCAAIVTETVRDGKAHNGRSLVANLAAANHYTVDHMATTEVQDVFGSAKVFYMTGFFLTVSPEAAMTFAKASKAKGGMYALNLSATFIMKFFKERLLEVLPYADYVFGNEDEAAALGEAMGWKGDLKQIALKLAAYEHKEPTAPRVVVFTHGSEPTITCVAGTNEIKEYPVLKLKKDDIVDVNGAGDAFVGGFLSVVVKGNTNVAACCRAGHYAASEILKVSGCTIPAHLPAISDEKPEK